MGLITESLERRFDEAFGINLREGGRNELLSHRSQVPIAPSEPSAEPTAQTAPLIAPRVNWNPGDQVKVSVQYPGAQEYINERATVVKVWPDGVCRIALDREISVIGGKPTKQFNLDGRYLVSESEVDLQTPSEPLALSKLSFEQSTAGVTKAELIQTLTPEQSLVPIAPSALAPEPPSPTETVDAQSHQLNLLPDFEPPSNSENRFAPDSENWA